jgi:hypothetical protein
MRGLRTSESTSTRDRSGSSEDSAAKRHNGLPSRMRSPASSTAVTPSSMRAPRPPSVVLVPPSPTRTRYGCASSAARSSIPTPRDDALGGTVLSTRVSAGSPMTVAASTSAPASGSGGSTTANGASCGRPNASTDAVTAHRVSGRSRSTSRVPSPPSAIGRMRTSAEGSASRTPAATARQASRAVRQPLNESQATTTTSSDTVCSWDPGRCASLRRRRQCGGCRPHRTALEAHPCG